MLHAKRFPERAIVVDGALDEAAWKNAKSTGPFVNPSSGREDPNSRVNAEAKIGWTDTHLYFAFEVDDDKPQSPFSAQDVDPHIWEQSSAVELMIQPGDPKTNRHYYEVQVDVAKAVWDTQFDDYNQPITTTPGSGTRFGHQEWKSHAKRAVRVDEREKRYTMEVALPWTSFSSQHSAIPPKRGDVWRINLYSFRDGQRDSMSWSPILKQGNFHRASRFGKVQFVR